MRLKYDLNVGALYIGLSDRAVARTRAVDDNTCIDLDENGAVVGIEVIAIGHPWPLEDVLRDYSIAAAAAAQLRAYFRPSPPVTVRGSLPDTTQEAPALSIAPISVAA
jgi:uncharacterized protein YuzE